MTYYRLESSGKDLKPKVIDWMGRNGYGKDAIAAFKKTKDNRCGVTMGAIAANLIKGMPTVRADFNQGRDTAEWLRNAIAEVVEEGKHDIDDSEEVVVVKTPAQVYNIQDRIREQAGQMSEELDAAIDNWIMDPEAFDPKAFKITNLLRGKGAKAAQARYIKGIFQRGLDELTELSSGKADEQLREAYSHVARKNIKKLIEFYQSIFTACDQIAQEAKTLKKPRAKKVKPAEELVKKIKFKVSDDKLGVTSVPAAGIIGASAAIVYNTKTRKLGIYQATSSAGLNVKGASIVDFTAKSFQKTLRKPDIQLKEFKEQNTQRRVETWFEKIKATETALNGRINAEIMILKIFK
jgi:DNA-directed RNA polymerase beta' subunit